jgi:TonB-linked SusC/RagA family outer membrane protein
MKKKVLQMLLLAMFGFISSGALAQIKVSGVVKSSDGGALPGATVVVKGTTTGAISDAEGKFNITVPSEQSVLQFSFVGMKTQEIPVGGKSVINVTLSSESIGVDEVVVTALGISREKKSLGYSVAEVKGDELQKTANVNALNSLAGKVSGVQINSTGAAGSSVSVVIRGASSLTSDNQPLYVVDGVPMNNTLNNVSSLGNGNGVDYGSAISDINSDDIESVSVLKGPSAAALYGSRAGNGVILITTKSGKNKKLGLGVTINSNTVIDNPYKYLDYLMDNGMGYGPRPYTQDMRPNNGLPYMTSDPTQSAWNGPFLDKGTLAYQWPYPTDANGNLIATPLVSHPDNVKNFFQTGFTTTNNIAITDQFDRGNFRLAFDDMENGGLIPNSDLHHKTISFNSTFKLNDKITVSSVINYVYSNAKNRPAIGNGTNPMQALYETNTQIDGNLLKDYWKPGQVGVMQNSPYQLGKPGSYVDNPYFLAYEVNNGFKRNRIYGNVKLDVQILKDLSFFARYSLDTYNEFRDAKIAKSYTKEKNGFYGLQNLTNTENNTDFLLTYNKKMSDFSLNASVGGNARYFYSASNSMQTKNGGTGLIVPGIFAITNTLQSNLVVSSGSAQKAVYSLYGLASLGFKDMVYLDLTARNDWSSTLPPQNRSYFYPSGSLSLLLNNMFDMGPKINMLKLRGGWAQVGNDTSPYQLLAGLSPGSWNGQTTFYVPGNLLNPTLKPEIKTSKEFGLNLGLFQNRLTFEGTYYVSDNRNQILNNTLAPSSSYGSQKFNAGLVTSKGVEFSLGGTPVKTQNVTWDLNVLWSTNTLTLKSLAPGVTHIILWTNAKGGAETWVGEKIGNIVDAEMLRVTDKNSPYYGWPLLDEDGYEQTKSVNEVDGKRNSPIIGNFFPNYMMGIQTSLRYKHWTLSASIDYRNGGQFVSQTLRYNESDLHGTRILSTFIHPPKGVDLPSWLKAHADLFGPNGTAFPVVGGPTADYGGLTYSDGGITLNDGVFMPGVSGSYDASGKFTADQEFLSQPTDYYGDYYGWGLTKTATFDADFVKLRDLTISYQLPDLKSLHIHNASIAIYTSNVILWTKAKIGIDPETAFQNSTGGQNVGIGQFAQGIVRDNVSPWTIPVGLKLNVSF